jgi:hypothetical protein
MKSLTSFCGVQFRRGSAIPESCTWHSVSRSPARPAAARLRLIVRVTCDSPRQLERGAWFLSTQHDEAVIDEPLAAINAAARTIG